MAADLITALVVGSNRQYPGVDPDHTRRQLEGQQVDTETTRESILTQLDVLELGVCEGNRTFIVRNHHHRRVLHFRVALFLEAR